MFFAVHILLKIWIFLLNTLYIITRANLRPMLCRVLVRYKVCHACYFNQSSVRHLFLISRPRPSLCSLRSRRKWNHIVFGCHSGAAKKNQTTFLLQKKKKLARLTIVFLHLQNFEIHIFVFYQRMNFYCLDKVERNVIVVTLTLRAAREFD